MRLIYGFFLEPKSDPERSLLVKHFLTLKDFELKRVRQLRRLLRELS